MDGARLLAYHKSVSVRWSDMCIRISSQSVTTLLLAAIAVDANATNVNYDTTGSTLRCNGVAGCVQNTSTSVTIGGFTLTFNPGFGSNVVPPTLSNPSNAVTFGNLVAAGTGPDVSVAGLLLAIHVNSTPPGSNGQLLVGLFTGSLSTINNRDYFSAAVIFNRNISTDFGLQPGVVIGDFIYQLGGYDFGLNPITPDSFNGQTPFDGGVTALSEPHLLPLTRNQAFGAVGIPLNGSTSLTFTITNPNDAPVFPLYLRGPLPDGLIVATPSAFTNTCGGWGGTVYPGITPGVNLSDGIVAGHSTCTVSFNVVGKKAGVKVNTVIWQYPSAGDGSTSTAALTVITPNVIAPPTITQAFGAVVIPFHGATSLTFTIGNPNATALNAISFADVLPLGLAFASPDGLTSNCGDATVAATGPPASLSLSAGSLAGGASCTVSANVVGITTGSQVNNVVVSDAAGGTGNTATATLLVGSVASPILTMSFASPVLTFSPATQLYFSVTNPNASALDFLDFTDTLPAGMVVSTPNDLIGGCYGGTITASPGSGLISLSAATLAASASCTFSVSVSVAASDGTLVNVATPWAWRRR